uniref:Putative ATPase domain containing protein n=1 Tax=viral metagenome TaxID=1070528 RepID=A0A6M3XV90_9ZZZZ
MLPLAQWKEMIQREPESNDIIKDILPSGSTEYLLICGRSGIGKTNLALYLAFCLATEQPFFSHKTKRTRVGYLAFEGQQRKLLARFDKLSKSFPDPSDFLLVERSLPFKLHNQGITKLTRIIEGLDVVIIDPLRYVVYEDYMKPEPASNFISALKECCAKTGTVAILLHHIRKPDKRIKVHPEDLQYEIKGATEYVDAAVTVLLLERTSQRRNKTGGYGSNPDDRILHFVKVKDAPAEFDPLNLRFNRDTLLFEPITERYDNN